MKDDKPDYCSGFPDGSWGERACKPHDEGYERGGHLLHKIWEDAKLAWRVATTPAKKGLSPADWLKARAAYAALGVVMGVGVFVLHPAYKTWGWITGRRVGFRWSWRRRDVGSEDDRDPK